MKIGIHKGTMWKRFGEDAKYARLAELGYDTVDEDLADIKQPWYSDKAVMEAECGVRRRAAERHGIEIYQVHGPWPTDDTSEEKRVTAWDMMKRAVYGAYCLGSPNLVIHPQMPFGWGGPEDADEAERITVEMLRSVMPDAEKYGVTVCLENMPFKAQRISTMDYILRTVEQVDSPNIGICFDTGHANLYSHDLGEPARIAGKYLKALHVHDNDGTRDSHQMPYSGTADWDSFIRGVAETGYDGPMSLETGGYARGELPDELFDEAERLNAMAARHLADAIEAVRRG
ncbi:MAG: sugar phosphate isomerase/epimerase [Clostridia bacterium]|nr:sugar phosphate isomerase/epimerase [Clostridia bacterium]